MVCRSNKKFFSAQCRIGQAAAQSAHWGNPPAPIVPAADGCGHRRAGRPVSWGSARPFPCCRHRQRWRRSAPAVWGRSGAGFPARRPSRQGRHPGLHSPKTWRRAPRHTRTDPAWHRTARQYRWNGIPRQTHVLPPGCPPQNRWNRPEDPLPYALPLLLLIFAAKQCPALQIDTE